jgi:3-mercaptopyruvate sulfurtransferase SseA
VVVVAILAGAIASLAKDQSAVANRASGPVATAQPLGSQSIPNPEVPRISLEETTGKLEQGQAVLIDVRSSESFAKSHAAGAISMPESEIEARLQELARDKDLVLY